MYNLVYSYVHNKEDTEEIIQDTLIGALNGIDDFRSESSIKTWVYKIATNKSKDFIKYKTRQKRSAIVVSIDRERHSPQYEPINSYHPGVLLENKEDYELLWSCIEKLPENQRNALILAKIDKKPQAEIGQIMNISTKAVESLISRAKSNLRKHINTNYGR